MIKWNSWLLPIIFQTNLLVLDLFSFLKFEINFSFFLLLNSTTLVIHVSGEEWICWMSEWMVLFPLSVGPLCTIYVYLAVSESVTAVELSWRPHRPKIHTKRFMANERLHAHTMANGNVCVRACVCVRGSEQLPVYFILIRCLFCTTDMPCMLRWCAWD